MKRLSHNLQAFVYNFLDRRRELNYKRNDTNYDSKTGGIFMKYKHIFSTVLSYQLEKLFLTRGSSEQIQIQAHVEIDRANFATRTTSYARTNLIFVRKNILWI